MFSGQVVKHFHIHGRQMVSNNEQQVFVDGAPIDFFYKGEAPLDDAKRFALRHSLGHRSLRIVALLVA